MMTTASSSGERRIVMHLITGDSIQTNFAAVRFVLAYFKLSSPWANRITYRVVFVKCGSHRGNMVCVTAVCGHPAKDPGGSEICANLVRPETVRIRRKPSSESVGNRRKPSSSEAMLRFRTAKLLNKLNFDVAREALQVPGPLVWR